MDTNIQMKKQHVETEVCEKEACLKTWKCFLCLEFWVCGAERQALSWQGVHIKSDKLYIT